MLLETVKKTVDGQMKLLASHSVLASTLAFGTAVADADEQPLWLFSDPFVTSAGVSYLTRLDDTIIITAETGDLNRGDAVTLWWVVFNNPAGCTILGFCGAVEEDFTEAGIVSAQIGLGNATGNVLAGASFRVIDRPDVRFWP